MLVLCVYKVCMKGTKGIKVTEGTTGTKGTLGCNYDILD